MKKIITLSLLLALATWTGRAQIVCHVEGELMSNKYGYNIVICEAGTDLRANDDPSLHVRAVNGKFSKTIECDHIKKYQIFLFNEYRRGYWRFGEFFAENGTVKVKLYADQPHVVESDGLLDVVAKLGKFPLSDTSEMVKDILAGNVPETNATYANGVMDVPSYNCTPLFADVNNYKELLLDSGYYTEDQLAD